MYLFNPMPLLAAACGVQALAHAGLGQTGLPGGFAGT